MPLKETATDTVAPKQAMSKSWLAWLVKDGVFNCFWFILPILLWNLFFTLPGKYAAAVFWRDIPPLITYGENTLRMMVILFPLLMASHIQRRSQHVGLLVYGVGLGVYAASWLALILFPASAWSMSLMGFLAPTYTPLVWAVGIGLIGDRLHWHSGYRPWIYITMAVAFTLFHMAHATIVFTRAM